MESKRIPMVAFLLVIILMTGLSTDKNIKKIANFDCFADYDKQLVCFWEVVNSNSSCKEDFQLKYTDDQGMRNICQTMENDHYQGFRLLDKCVCNITLAGFIASQDITMEVESHGQCVNKTTISVYTKVKPKPPSNVHVTVSDSEMGVVTWDINYNYKFIKESLSFQVQILSKKDRKMALQDNHTQSEFRYMFNKRQLTREDHVVRVRAKPAEGKGLKGFWSEWSPEVIWRNEYDLTILELKNIIIPVFCSVMLCLILSSYFIFSRYKRKWWKNIPDPSKSKIYQDRLGLKQQPKPDRQNVNMFCSCLSRLIRAKQKTKAGPQTDISKHHSNEKNDLNKIVFKPEDDDVERCVELCPKADSKNNPVQEETQQDSTGDHLLEVDLSIARMFCDILGDSSDVHMEALDNPNVRNTFGIFCWPNKLNSSSQDQMIENELNTKLGYHHHSDSFKGFQTKLDDVKTLYFDSLVSLEKDYPLEYREKIFISPNDDNFDGTLSECSSNKTTLQCFMEKSQRISYYNSELCLFSHAMEDKCPSSTTTQPDISQSTVQSHKHPVSSSNCDHVAPQIPTSFVCEEPRYESSDENQQRDSGSQSFIGTDQRCAPTNVGKVDKQQHFDQAVQQYDCTSVCQVFGYQHLEQADQKMSRGTDCLGCNTEYQPFQSPASPHKNGCLSEPDSEYQVGDGHCQNNLELSGNKNDRKSFNSDLEHVVFPRFHLGVYYLNDRENIVMGRSHPSNVCNVLDEHRSAAGVPRSEMTLNLGGDAFALTFDIRNHLRNLKNMHGQNMQLKNVKHGIQTINETSFPCSLD